VSATADPAARPRRADAVRNHERVVQAAAEVFAEKGLGAGVDEVAARAGVGKATVYRSFPTKERLVAAVACERLRWFERRAAAAAESEDPWEAFVGLLRTAAEAQPGNRILSGSLASVSDLPEVRQAREAMAGAMDRLVGRAQAQGAMRADATPQEVRVLFAGVARVLSDERERDVAVWRRYADLIAAALRA
jgi:AcrR family transcriptional regulator